MAFKSQQNKLERWGKNSHLLEQRKLLNIFFLFLTSLQCCRKVCFVEEGATNNQNIRHLHNCWPPWLREE